ncbi:MAG: hypothetical protein LBQ88_17105, partial [Treponema sp.]|nr:hypothetical protein [Treponema sp.]
MVLRDKPLSREDLKRVIEGRGAARRIPMMIHEWINAGTFKERAPEYQAVLDQYPCDIVRTYLNIPQVFNAPADDPS